LDLTNRECDFLFGLGGMQEGAAQGDCGEFESFGEKNGSSNFCSFIFGGSGFVGAS